MIDADWSSRFHDRTTQYLTSKFDRGRSLTVKIAEDYACTYEGQVAALVAASLLARSVDKVCISVPDRPVVSDLP